MNGRMGGLDLNLTIPREGGAICKPTRSVVSFFASMGVMLHAIGRQSVVMVDLQFNMIEPVRKVDGHPRR